MKFKKSGQSETIYDVTWLEVGDWGIQKHFLWHTSCQWVNAKKISILWKVNGSKLYWPVTGWHAKCLLLHYQCLLAMWCRPTSHSYCECKNIKLIWCHWISICQLSLNGISLVILHSSHVGFHPFIPGHSHHTMFVIQVTTEPHIKTPVLGNNTWCCHK